MLGQPERVAAEKRQKRMVREWLNPTKPWCPSDLRGSALGLTGEGPFRIPGNPCGGVAQLVRAGES
jgi:hypothetical protein